MRVLLQQYITFSHDTLEATLGEPTADQARAMPAGRANSIAANYAHVVTSEDYFVNAMAQGKPPLMATTMAGATGLSEPPQQGDWSEWARGVEIDMPALRAYAGAVYANTDAFLASLSDDDLDRTIDLTAIHFGHVPLPLFLTIFVGGNIVMHTGEISYAKGLQGLQGYPF
jgi:hypothetical protein